MVSDQSQSDAAVSTGRNTATPFLAFLFGVLIVIAFGLYIGQVSMEVKPDTASMTNNEIVNKINVTESSLSLHYNDSTTPSRAYLLHNGTTIDRQILSVAENEVVFTLPREHYTRRNISVNYTVRFEGSDRVLDELNVKVYPAAEAAGIPLDLYNGCGVSRDQAPLHLPRVACEIESIVNTINHQ